MGDNEASLSMRFFARIEGNSRNTYSSERNCEQERKKNVAGRIVNNIHYSVASAVPRPLDNAQHHLVQLRQTFVLLLPPTKRILLFRRVRNSAKTDY
jgi:hypothetical protein